MSQMLTAMGYPSLLMSSIISIGVSLQEGENLVEGVLGDEGLEGGEDGVGEFFFGACEFEGVVLGFEDVVVELGDFLVGGFFDEFEDVFFMFECGVDVGGVSEVGEGGGDFAEWGVLLDGVVEELLQLWR
jgi:hypothetical protein